MRRRVKLWLLAVAAIVVVGCFAAYRLRTPMLLEKATCIAGVSTWEQPGTMGMNPQSYTTYHWLSDRHLLFLRSIDDVLCLRDLKADKETPFRKVSQWWAEDGTYKKRIEISPDGQWILWDSDYRHDADGVGSFHGYDGARRDGTGRFHVVGMDWPQGYSFRWLSDSRHFHETTARYIDKTHEYNPLRAVMRSVDAPGKMEPPPYDDSAIAGEPAYPPTPGGRLIVHEPPTSPGWPPKETVLSEFLLTRTPKRLHRWTIKTPTGEERREMAVSPRGDRIAWIIVSAETSPLAALLHRIYPQFNIVPQNLVRLCVSRIDGTDMHDIGVLDVPSNSNDWPGPANGVYPFELKWLPDGRQLSFIHHADLYTIDAG